MKTDRQPRRLRPDPLLARRHRELLASAARGELATVLAAARRRDRRHAVARLALRRLAAAI